MKKKNGIWYKQMEDSKKKRGTFFRKMILVYAISTTIILLLFGVLVGILVQRSYTEELLNLNEKGLMQSASTCTTTLENLYSYYYKEVNENAELLSVMTAPKYTKRLSIDVNKLNAKLSSYSNLVKSCYVINFKGEFVCSTTDTYKRLDSFFDQSIVEQLQDYIDVPMVYDFAPRVVKYKSKGREYEEKYISLILKRYNQGFLVINLDYHRFMEMVNYRNDSAATQTLLLNSRGDVIIDSKEELFGTSYLQGVGMAELAEQKADSGSLKIKGKAVNYRTNEYFGITYMSILDYGALNGNALLIHIFVYAVLAMLINLSLVFLGTCLLYKPIGRLQDLIHPGAEDNQRGTDEFLVIENAFQTMKKTFQEYHLSLRKKALMELMEDRSLNDQSQQEEVRRLQEAWGQVRFLTVNLYPDLDNLEESELEDITLTIFSIVNIFREQLPKNVRMETIDYGDYVACIMGIEVSSIPLTDGEEMKLLAVTGVEKAIKGMQERMWEFFKIDVAGSIGCLTQSIYDISESYTAAKMAAFFQTTREKGAILYFSEWNIQEEAQVYPQEKAKKITDAIRNADKGKVREYVLDYFYAISHYSFQQSVRCIHLLELELTRQEVKYQVGGTGKECDLMGDIRKGSSLYKTQEYCLRYCLDMTDTYKETKENNPNMKQIVQQIKTLVEENISQPELTVNWLAKEVYLSTSYLRNIFKEITGNTLSGYIIERRLEIICQLLRDTDMGVQQIADQMGFSSKSYLYTFFKNYKGMTPNQYRMESRERKE